MMRTALTAAALAFAAPAIAQTAPATAAAADPARLAAAEKAVASLVPEGIYMKMMRNQFPRMMDAMMAQMMGQTPNEMGMPEAGADGDKPMRETAAKADPHFEERMRIMTRVMGEEMGTVFEKIEPRVRTGLSRAFARKFTIEQLDAQNAFFATPAGKAFANEYLTTFMDPEVMQEMMAAMPEMMKAMPAIMAKVEKATAHLPAPPEPKGAQ
ncbi:DUF2059 domain-containing protein [Sphingomonas koreensis]|jgi:hypothetical protein|uniref:DUF2059 domain-containing protein n=2 Tax=Sphingomonas koreensis TaxID=93064 RepID=A0A430C1U4_9SPHN|nr:DUF2059 domain-containing protein [Sphingomonas koreensis]MDC7812386.1 DUF2059 domain-containing protein [Sphingomonas koreensis]RSU22837.1 DUF2059 domain-containing protein [Sphingomonas koreensis]RSU30689.1 DUF2059 domain-containing protein [Sphingomonas koreensis]RSU31784.1 DUF2059 domain-containing protein [Sphingomonas koreensis]RSU39295.1 DUF2059 domain-containing protein [Sphingomonas koreensis]